MKNYKDLILAIAKYTFSDLIDAYIDEDLSKICSCEKFFLSGNSLFDWLDLDGEIFVAEAKRRALAAVG